MRWLAIVFLVLIAALQYPIWLGKGGWLRVRDLNAQVAAQRETNAELKARNEALDSEVRDLKQGVEAVEERARSELGMIRHDEIFFQLAPGDSPASALSPHKRGSSDVQGKDTRFPLEPAPERLNRGPE
jgi:cell division protein FtsB